MATESKVYVKQEPYVDEVGIHKPVNPYVPEGSASVYEAIISKEMFIEAYNKYIGKPKGGRMYKGGWKSRA